MQVRLERIDPLPAVYAYAFSDSPEEDATKKLMDWTKSRGLMENNSVSRLFGRNTYPTDKSEPHGYELYLTVEGAIEAEGDIKSGAIPGGLYAVMRFKNLYRIGEAWEKLWKWIETSEYEHVGWKKGENGWVGGFEEQVNWKEQKQHTDWVFDLWVQLKE